MTARHNGIGPRRRPAFTLIELLVVIFLIGFLAGLAILFVPNLNEQQRAPRGAVMLQQWLIVAKNNALRDRAGRGVRLYLKNMQDPTNPSGPQLTVVTDAQYIEQPDDFAVTPGVAAAPADTSGTMLPVRRIYTTTNTQTIALEPGPATAADFSGGFTDSTLWPVQTGDYLEVNGGLPHIISVTSSTTLSLSLSSLPAAIPQTSPTANYRIIRSPRTVGTEQMQLPLDIIIDAGTNATYNSALPLTQIGTDNTTTPPTAVMAIDILYSPSGAVITRGAGTRPIYLWVRDSTLPLGQGDNTLVAIYPRTGATFAFPVDNTPGGDPYSIAKTGRAPQS